MLKLIIQKYFQNVRKAYTLSGKIQSERWKSFERVISSEKLNVLVTVQPFPEVWRIFAEFGYFWNEFGESFLFLQFFISMRFLFQHAQPCLNRSTWANFDNKCHDWFPPASGEQLLSVA